MAHSIRQTTITYKYPCPDDMIMRVSVEAYGCTLNQGESKLIEESLRAAGHDIVPVEKADTALILTCCVIKTTERKMLKRIKELESITSNLIVGGCMASVMREKISRVHPDAVFMGPFDLENLLAMIRDAKGSRNHSAQRDDLGRAIHTIIPMGNGCNQQCSYCITRLARGQLRSYSEDCIISLVSRRLEEGWKEVRLASQDTAAYGKDINSSLPHLLRRICSIQGDFRVRVGMANIANILPILAETMDAFESDKIYKFLHIPVQSGDDYVLKKMRRRYSVTDFIEICELFRSRFPGSSISTDIIIGFPGETEEQFKSSVELVREIEPDVLNITRFSAREGTEAFKMDNQIPGWISKERSRKLTKVRTEICLRKNKSLIGSIFHAMTTEHVKKGTTMCRTDSYRPVVVPEELDLGRFCHVEITGATDAYLLGKVVQLG